VGWKTKHRRRNELSPDGRMTNSPKRTEPKPLESAES
jgi:hypothetical protein